MLNVDKEQLGDLTTLHLSGEIEESSDFGTLIGSVSRQVVVNCRGVSRINSTGVVGWIRYFTELTQNGHTLRFVECSSPVVEQINLIVNFLAGGAVESIFIPYSCTHCRLELRALLQVEDLKKMSGKIPEAQCSSCKSIAVFDDLPDAYLGFLDRQST